MLLGRLHPLIVHFPIGLIVAGALHEVVSWARRRPVPSDVGSFCLALGLLSGGLAVWLGTLNASHQSITGDSARILEWHRYAGWALLMVGAAAFLAGRVARSRLGSGAARVYTGLVVGAALCVGVSGHFGGQLVYGSTYITSVLPWASAREPARVAAGAEPDATPAVAPMPPAAASGQPDAIPTPTPAPTPEPQPEPQPQPQPQPQPELGPEPRTERPQAPTAASRPEETPPVLDEEPHSAAGFEAPANAAPELVEIQTAAPAMTRIDFARDVRPILEATCVECHGPDKVKARLRMDSIAGLQQGGKSGPLAVPGDPETSLIMRRVLGLDDEDQMPLDNDPLTPAQLDILRRWIAEGAHYTSRTGTDSQP